MFVNVYIYPVYNTWINIHIKFKIIILINLHVQYSRHWLQLFSIKYRVISTKYQLITSPSKYDK